jgi:hypothetical protein
MIAIPPQPPLYDRESSGENDSGLLVGKSVQMEEKGLVEEKEILTIGVCIWDTSEAVIPVDVEFTTRTCDICRYVAFSLSLTAEDCDYYRLILVCTLVNDATHANCHHLRTLDNDELIFTVARTVSTKKTKGSKYTFKSVAWYFKDVRSSPICFNNEEISGSSSDDECNEQSVKVSNDDLSYIMEADRRGYLYKRSSRDPNLWKRRFCALTDKFWCINTKRSDFKAICIPLNDDVLAQDTTPSFNFPNVIVIHSPWRVKYFRANSRQEQQGWVFDLNERAQLSKENGVLHMAEMICCDEEETANDRILKIMQPLFESDAVLISLIALDIHCNGSQYIKDHYFKAGCDMDSDSDSSPRSCFDGECDGHDYQRYSLDNYFASDDLVQSEARAGFYANRFASNSPAFAMSVNNPSSYRLTAIQYYRLSLWEGARYMQYSDVRTYMSLERTSKATNVSLVHALHDMNPSLATILNFINAVQRYKSLHRRDINIPNRSLWLEATTLFNRYLSKVPVMGKQYHKKAKKSPLRGNGHNASPSHNEAIDSERFDTVYDHGLVFVNPTLVEIVRDELVSFIAVRKRAPSSAEAVSSAQRAEAEATPSLLNTVTSVASPALADGISPASGFWSWLDSSFSLNLGSPILTPTTESAVVSPTSDNGDNVTRAGSDACDGGGAPSQLTELELDGWLGLMNVCVPAAVECAAGMYEFVDRQPSLVLFDEIVSVIISTINSDKLSVSYFYKVASTVLDPSEFAPVSRPDYVMPQPSVSSSSEVCDLNDPVMQGGRLEHADFDSTDIYAQEYLQPGGNYFRRLPFYGADSNDCGRERSGSLDAMDLYCYNDL